MLLWVCVQGTFLQCKKASAAAVPGADDVVHYYHESCQVVRDEKSLCPHCGEQSAATELEVTADTWRNMTAKLMPPRPAP